MPKKKPSKKEMIQWKISNETMWAAVWASDEREAKRKMLRRLKVEPI